MSNNFVDSVHLFKVVFYAIQEMREHAVRQYDSCDSKLYSKYYYGRLEAFAEASNVIAKYINDIEAVEEVKE